MGLGMKNLTDKEVEVLICRCSHCFTPMIEETYRTVSQRTGAVILETLFRCHKCGDKKRFDNKKHIR
jgi:RNase P subunit RPR2